MERRMKKKTKSNEKKKQFHFYVSYLVELSWTSAYNTPFRGNSRHMTACDCVESYGTVKRYFQRFYVLHACLALLLFFFCCCFTIRGFGAGSAVISDYFYIQYSFGH